MGHPSEGLHYRIKNWPLCSETTPGQQNEGHPTVVDKSGQQNEGHPTVVDKSKSICLHAYPSRFNEHICEKTDKIKKAFAYLKQNLTRIS